MIAGKGELRERLRAMAAGDAPLDPALLDPAREGERVVPLIEAIVTDARLPELAVNVRNDGRLPGLGDAAVVELPGVADARGVHSAAVPSLPPAVTALLRARSEQQELTVEAALSGERKLALQALLADPLVPAVSVAERMLDEVLRLQASLLPRFA